MKSILSVLLFLPFITVAHEITLVYKSGNISLKEDGVPITTEINLYQKVRSIGSLMIITGKDSYAVFADDSGNITEVKPENMVTADVILKKTTESQLKSSVTKLIRHVIKEEAGITENESYKNYFLENFHYINSKILPKSYTFTCMPSGKKEYKVTISDLFDRPLSEYSFTEPSFTLDFSTINDTVFVLKSYHRIFENQCVYQILNKKETALLLKDLEDLNAAGTHMNEIYKQLLTAEIYYNHKLYEDYFCTLIALRNYYPNHPSVIRKILYYSSGSHER
jgi:hypothetical protein